MGTTAAAVPADGCGVCGATTAEPEALMAAPLRFLGMIGSRNKWDRFTHRVQGVDVDDSQLDLIKCPVGLDIAALTPEEIAISVIAQMIEVRRGGPQWS